MTTASLMWSVLFGSLGSGYCIYGARQRAFVPFVSGVGLVVLPHLLSSIYVLVAVCIGLAAAPFVIKL